MKMIHFILVIALFIASSDALGHQKKCFQKDTEIYLDRPPITHIILLHGSSEAACQLHCQNVGACKSFVYNTHVKSCSLLSIDFESATLRPHPGIISGPKICKKDPTCGKTFFTHSRVIAGKTATRGSWPWQILLLKDWKPHCGGSIVGPKHIVTAAHCIEKEEMNPSKFLVAVGEHDTSHREGMERWYRVKKIYEHPDYNQPSMLNNDIAVLEVDPPIMFNRYAQPVCLPDKSLPSGTDCYVTGWGKTRHPGYMTHLLQQAKMKIVSNGECYKKNHSFMKVPITWKMLCTGDGGQTRKSSCHGDSGGPVVCPVNGRWELHGLVSFGSPRCRSDETYDVNVRVTEFKKWIEDIMHKV